MPSRLDTSEIPADASRARKGIDGAGRTLALKYLLNAPDSTRPQIATGAGISVAAAQDALLDLERLGWVTADLDGPRNGKKVRYSAVRGAVTQDLEALTSWLLN